MFSLDTGHQDVDAFGFWRGSVPYVFPDTAESRARGQARPSRGPERGTDGGS